MTQKTKTKKYYRQRLRKQGQYIGELRAWGRKAIQDKKWWRAGFFIMLSSIILTSIWAIAIPYFQSDKTTIYEGATSTSFDLNPGESHTFTISPADNDTDEKGETLIIAIDDIKPKIIANGVCVDKALCVLSILERSNKLNKNIFVAVGGTGFDWHCQVVKVAKKENKYYKLGDSFDVIAGDKEFWQEPPAYYKPEIFRKAAMLHNPLSYIEMRDFAAKHG